MKSSAGAAMGALGLSAAVGLLAAGAASAHTVAATPHAIRLAAPFAVASGYANPYQAGYDASTASSGTLSGTVVVPKLTCTSKDTNDVVIDWYLQGTRTSDGNFGESGGQIFLSCQSGDSIDNVIDNGGVDSSSVSAGDVIAFSDSASATGETMTYTDETSGATGTDTGAGIATQDALVLTQGLDDSSTPTMLFPKFSPVKYSSVMVDGAPLGAAGPGAFTQVSTAGKKQITTSTITKQTNFTNTFVSG